MRGSSVPVALIAAVLALPACGGTGESGDSPGGAGETGGGDAVALYEQELAAAAQTVRATSDRLADDTVDPEQLLTQLEEASRRVDQSSPPYEALPGHQRLSQSLGEAIDAAAGLAGTQPPYPPAQLEQLRSALAEAEAALGVLEEQGYDVGGA